MYGNKFISSYGEKPLQMWAMTINELKDYEIKRGLRKLLMKGSGTPPTLPQFVAACKYSDEEESQPLPNNLLPKEVQYDAVHCQAQGAMMAYLMLKSVPKDFLPVMIQIKSKMANDFRGMMAEEEMMTYDEIKNLLFVAWDRARH